MACISCLRERHVRWVCPHCGMPQAETHSIQCSKCHRPHPCVHHATAHSCRYDSKRHTIVPIVTATEKDESEEVCGRCSASNSNSFLACWKCGELNRKHKNLRLWFCTQCSAANYGLWSQCKHCGAPKAPRAVTMVYQPWVCGCGQQNNPTKLRCSSCSDASNLAYTCPHCRVKGPVAQEAVQLSESVSLRVSVCRSCRHEHPRDVLVLRNARLPVPCAQCGETLDTPTSVCANCGFAPPVSPLLGWTCPKCMKPARGYACRTCTTPNPEFVEHLFSWKCDGTEDASSSGGDLHEGCAVSEGVGLLSNSEPCGTWNPSWKCSCSACNGSRLNGAAIHKEARAKYGPWTCRTCKKEQRADQVLFCGTKNCNGVEWPEECSRCGTRHVAWQCPSRELVAVVEQYMSVNT